VRILFATRNSHKCEEVRSLFKGIAGLEMLNPDEVGLSYQSCEDDLEPFDTFEENASSKARYFHQISGLPTLADDSGLVVDCLNGLPGINSKRFSSWSKGDAISQDEANNEFLVQSLECFRNVEWTARYVCLAVFLDSKANMKMTRGEVEGEIIEIPKGRNGFGYDPHFLVKNTELTFAEMSDRKKNRFSHRGKAFRKLVEEIKSDL
jgi:XTP/dITP diphosphohydrolase